MPRKKTTSPDTTPSSAAEPKRRSARTKPPVAETAPVSAVATEEATNKPKHHSTSSTHRKKTPAESPLSAELETAVEPVVETPQLSITRDDIATLAFSYWERRGYQGGSPEEDWQRAERELKSLLKD